MSPIAEGGMLLVKTKRFLRVMPCSLKASSVLQTAEKLQFSNKYYSEA